MRQSLWNVLCLNCISLSEAVLQVPILACLQVKIKRLWSRTDTQCWNLLKRKELKAGVICDIQNLDIPDILHKLTLFMLQRLQNAMNQKREGNAGLRNFWLHVLDRAIDRCHLEIPCKDKVSIKSYSAWNKINELLEHPVVYLFLLFCEVPEAIYGHFIHFHCAGLFSHITKK